MPLTRAISSGAGLQSVALLPRSNLTPIYSILPVPVVPNKILALLPVGLVKVKEKLNFVQEVETEVDLVNLAAVSQTLIKEVQFDSIALTQHVNHHWPELPWTSKSGIACCQSLLPEVFPVILNDFVKNWIGLSVIVSIVPVPLPPDPIYQPVWVKLELAINGFIVPFKRLRPPHTLTSSRTLYSILSVPLIFEINAIIITYMLAAVTTVVAVVVTVVELILPVLTEDTTFLDAVLTAVTLLILAVLIVV